MLIGSCSTTYAVQGRGEINFSAIILLVFK